MRIYAIGDILMSLFLCFGGKCVILSGIKLELL